MLGRLQPIGFWSYARRDEESARGKLSSLRARLQGELQQQYGRDQIRIFQDVAAIAPGDTWNRELRDAIQNSTFLVPIITPAFLESEWCCQEVMLFLARETELNTAHPQLKGRSRIFPIHYIDISSAEPFDPEVLPLLQTRQWLDFRPMRFSPEDDAKVQMTLATLAQGMNELLQVRVELPEPAAAPPPPRPRPAPAAPRGDEQAPRSYPLHGDFVPAPAPVPVATAKPWYMKPPVLVGGGVISGIALVLLLVLGSEDPAIEPGTTVTEATAAEATGEEPAAVEPDGAAATADAAADGTVAATPVETLGDYTVSGFREAFDPTPETKSVGDGSAAIKVVFDNQTDDVIDLWWIDFAGKPQLFQTLAPHTYHEQGTFAQHVWQLTRKSDGSVITALLPPAGGGTVNIVKG